MTKTTPNVKATNISELMTECKTSTFTDLESVCTYQDIIGHSSIEELAEVMNNEKTKETFYRVYGEAYGTLAAIKFHLEHSENIQAMREKLEDLEVTNEELEFKVGNMSKSLAAWEDQCDQLSKKVTHFKSECALKDMEIVKLKARLYDLSCTMSYNDSETASAVCRYKN